jgi:hypothetical protein
MRKLLIVVVDFIEEIVPLRRGAAGKWSRIDADPDCGFSAMSLIASRCIASSLET